MKLEDNETSCYDGYLQHHAPKLNIAVNGMMD